MSTNNDQNVIGTELQTCCTSPMTGFFRTGVCVTGPQDRGTHVVCAQITAEFLTYTKSQGNDLSTPVPGSSFPGLKPGDKWCLCATRFLQAHEEGAAPNLRLNATHTKTLSVVPLEILQLYAAD